MYGANKYVVYVWILSEWFMDCKCVVCGFGESGPWIRWLQRVPKRINTCARLPQLSQTQNNQNIIMHSSLFVLVLASLSSILALPAPMINPFPHGMCRNFYPIAPGDSFLSIGSELGIPIRLLKSLNPEIASSPSELLFPGQV